jgi:allantoin racemase
MVINPNTSESMTTHIRMELEKIKRQDTEVSVVHPPEGPETIETSYEEAHAIPNILKLVEKANRDGYDAVIIADYGDPGLEAAREISRILVTGIEEVALHVASMLGAKFSVLTPIRNRVPHKEKEVYNYKMYHSLASVRTTAMSVKDTDSDPEQSKKRIAEQARIAVQQDGAEVIILGCAGMVGYDKDLAAELRVVVLDPTSLALKICEAMVDMGLAQSKRALYATPSQ